MTSNLWDGIWGSVLAAVVSALVAIFVVRLTQHHERRLVLEQRRLEAFASLLSEWHDAWSVTQRGWKDYPEEERDGVIDTDSVQSLQASALNEAARRTRGAWQVWRLFLEEPSSIEEAAERAHTVLFMEWSYNRLLGRGALEIPLDNKFYVEWDQFLLHARRWHLARRRDRKKIEQTLDSLWRMPAKTTLEMINDFPYTHGLQVE